jgi:hypothetical protein
MTMNEANLKNLTVFLNRLADTGVLKGTNDLMAFGETYLAVQQALQALATPTIPEISKAVKTAVAEGVPA